MRLLVQRVSEASVTIGGRQHAAIGAGLLLLLGIETTDDRTDAEWLAAKVAALRIFGDSQGVMNLSVNDVKGQVLLISQFTLHAKTKKGNRPSYIRAAHPDVAIPLYEYMVDRLQHEVHGKVATGVFGADMKVALINDGPVTIWIDTKAKE
jgi:D-tyrosyl-tRNA(Tyr) deacylase